MTTCSGATRFLATLCHLAMLYGCGGTAPRVEPPSEAEAVNEGASSERAVIVFSAGLRAGPGRGARLGSLEPDTVVRVETSRDGWRWVEVEGDIRVAGWVRQERVGCRALRDVPLRPRDGGDSEVRLRAGALLAVLGRSGQTLDVETQGPLSVRGTIDARDCGVGRRFFPTRPTGATPHVLLREASLETDLEGGRHFMLPGGHRFAVVARQGRDVVGRTDEAVVIEGRLDARMVTPDKTTPFDRLAEPMGYTHEVVLEADLSTDRDGGEVFTTLPGGTPLVILRNEGERLLVRVAGRVRLEGWLDQGEVRRVSLDYNDLDPGARRRRHDPTERGAPREPDLAEEGREK